MPIAERWIAEGDALRVAMLRFIEDYTAEHSEAPSTTTIAEHFDRDATTIRGHVRRLEDEGFVRRERRQVVKL